ncbi:MAG TPA: DUF2950 domain-containing protein [Terriglobales bacterium]
MLKATEVHRAVGPVAMVLATAIAMLVTVSAQESGQKTFTALQDASKALYDAVKSGDKTAMEAVLGASSAPILSSGDPVQDQKNADFVTQRYEQMNRWGKETNGDETLFLGAENWPFPVPLKKNAAGQWYFDSKAGVEEVLYRRIGANELAAIRVCKALADAQDEYFGGTHDGDTVHQYAQKFISDEGKQNGLYWKTAEGEPQSPIGPVFKYAAVEGYSKSADPFHGYFFRMLTAQGAAAPGGAKSYIVDGKMTRGFAFVAYPAQYRNSGVMTFVVNLNGAVYEKDLGPKTADLANAMTAINPDSTWRAVANQTEEEAEEQ